MAIGDGPGDENAFIVHQASDRLASEKSKNKSPDPVGLETGFPQ
jgi:hypothetical protein